MALNRKEPTMASAVRRSGVGPDVAAFFPSNFTALVEVMKGQRRSTAKFLWRKRLERRAKDEWAKAKAKAT